MKKWMATFQNYFGGNSKLLTLVLCGVLLFIIAMPTKKKEESVASTAVPEQQTMEVTKEEYVEALERRLEESLSKVDGVGSVQVMISLKASEELVVEKEVSSENNSTLETDDAGGKRSVHEVVTQETTVYGSIGSEQQPYVIKTLLPEIQGVLVVAKGAGTKNVSRTIVEIVQALFDLEAHKVKVVKME